MKKFLLSIFCCLMAVFSVQAEEYSYTFTASQFTANGTKALGNVEWTLAGNGGYWGYDGTKGQQFGSSKKPYKSLSLSTNGIDGTITKIVINTSGASSVNASFTVSVGGTEYGSSTKITTTATDYTFEGSASGEIVLSYTQTSSKAIYIKSITVTYKTTGGEGGETPDPVDVAEPTFTPVDGTTFEESLAVTINAEEGLAVYYSTDNKVSYIEDNTVNITETTTVYAYAEDAEGNKSDVVEATYTKVDPNAKTATFDFTVPSELTPSVTNFVSDAFNTSATTFTNNGITLNTTDGSGTASRIWKGTSAYDLRVYKGATMTIAAPDGGVLTSIEFTGSTVNAFSANVGVLNEKVWTGSASSVVFTWSSDASTQKIQTVVVTYSIDENIVIVNQPTIAGGETFVGSTTVEITNNADGTTLYYSTDGVNYNVYTGALTINATTTVYAYAQDGEDNKSSVAEATFTEMEIISIADAKAAYDTAGANVAVAMDITGAVVTVNSGPYMFIETAEAGINIYSSGADYAVGTKFTTGYILGESAVYGKMHQITNAKFYDVVTETVEVTPEDVTIAELNADFDAYEGRYVRLTGVNINDKTITQGEDTYGLYNRFDFITAPTVAANCDIVAVVARYNTTDQVYPVSISNTVDVTAAGYATLYLGYPVAIPAGVEAYVVSAVNDGWVTLTQVTGVLPAETGVLVKAKEDEYEFVYSAGEVASIGSSLLNGTVATTDITPAEKTTYYVLAKGENGVGLYKDELDGGTFRNNANKAYLPVVVESGNGIASYSFNFEWNGTTGVEGVVAEGAQDGAIYDITGRRVKAITAPGIYIVNGRKVVK